MRDYPNISQRAMIVGGNAAIFYACLFGMTGLVVPDSSLQSLWFLSGISLWLFSLLSSPWFRPPRDTFANAVTALILLATATIPATTEAISNLALLKIAGIIWASIVAVISLVALIRHDKSPLDPAGRFLHRLCDTIGRGEILYTAPALIGILGGFESSSNDIAILSILWIMMVVVKPVELAFSLYRSLSLDLRLRELSPQVGMIERIDHPNIVRVKLLRSGSWRAGALHIAAMPDGGQEYLLALFTQVQGSEVVGTGICVAKVADPIVSSAGCVHESHDLEKTKEFIANLSGAAGAEIAGFTVERSSIGSIWFESSEALDLAEGEVVFTRIRGDQIFYQIVEAQTAEETFDQNPRGTHLVRASQLGAYSPECGFTKYPWLPTMNMPVFRATDMKFAPPVLTDRQFIIGNVPSTNIGVPVNIDDLITYHSAILGVTGTGKTELALFVIREAVEKGAKVFCVDFTGEYRHRLADLNPTFPSLRQVAIDEFDAKLFAVDTGAYGAGAEKKDLDAFLKTVRAHVASTVEKFLKEDEHQLASEMVNTKAGRGSSLPIHQRVLQHPSPPLVSGWHQPAGVRSKGGIMT